MIALTRSVDGDYAKSQGVVTLQAEHARAVTSGFFVPAPKRFSFPVAGWVREYKTREGNTAHRSCNDYEPPGRPCRRSYFVKIQEGIMPISNTSATSRRTQTLSEIQSQCRRMALALSFSISKLRNAGNPVAAKRLQNASIILSAVADDLESILNGGES